VTGKKILKYEKKKGKEEPLSFSQNIKMEIEKSYFGKYYRSGSSPWAHEVQVNCHVMLLIDQMMAGHCSCTTTVNRFNIECSQLNVKVVMGYKQRNISFLGGM
jgi:hypothetical protein